MNLKTHLYLFRHGQTDWNVNKKIQGHSNTPLNETGRQQARELKKTLAELNLRHILSSDLDRAAETARLASEGLNIPISYTSDLREGFFGPLEGKTLEEIKNELGDQAWARWMSMHPKDLEFALGGVETKRQLQLRALRAVLSFVVNQSQLSYIEDEIEKAMEVKPKLNGRMNLGVCSHGGIISLLLQKTVEIQRIYSEIDGPAPTPVHIKNGSVFEIEILENGQWSLLTKVAG